MVRVLMEHDGAARLEYTSRFTGKPVQHLNEISSTHFIADSFYGKMILFCG